MRFRAVATDPMDFTRALRPEMGLEAELRAHEPVMVVAVPMADANLLPTIVGMTAEAGVPAVIWTIDVPFKLHEPARVMVLLPTTGGCMVKQGLTFWAGASASSPLLAASPKDGSAFAVAAQGLVRLPCPPLGLEASMQPGIERACDRLTDRMLATANLRDVLSLAA